MKHIIFRFIYISVIYSAFLLNAEPHSFEEVAIEPLYLVLNESKKKDSSELAGSLIEAAQAAEEFVELLDQGKFAETWARGAALFQRTISQQEWSLAVQLARQKLGRVKSRTLKDEKPAWDPVGLPKGAYMVVEYNTSFERAPHSGELLTLMEEKNGSWKVLTYRVN